MNNFVVQNNGLVDKNMRSYYFNVSSNRWLATRLEIVANSLVVVVCIFATVSKGKEDGMKAALWALAIQQAVGICQTLNWFVRQQSELETHVVSVERVKEYAEIAREAYGEDDENVKESGHTSQPSAWPSTGKLTFENYGTRYREGLDLVVENIDLEIKSGERIGIVGRTGAGKSSLTLALFRLIEPAEGKILIDDVDITTIGLNQLRRKLTIIPQDPVLWTGSLKYNLDPLGTVDDEKIWLALERSNLKQVVADHPDQKGLETQVSEGGENFSVGQRQLFCLARALIRKSKILVMDEATAAVDPATDALIQKTIRTEFTDCTVLTIAHRLNTILDYDKILVLDKVEVGGRHSGQVAQFDTPRKLLEMKRGIFYDLCADAGLDENSLAKS